MESIDLMEQAIILVGHGTRQQRGMLEFLRFAALVRMHCTQQFGLSPHGFAHAFLELQAPDVLTAVDRCHRRGASRVILSPLLLASAGHMKNDLPRLQDEAQRRFPDLQLDLFSAIGDEWTLARLCSNLLIETGAVPALAGDAAVLLVCRGSRDSGAMNNGQAIAGKIKTLINSERVYAASLNGQGPSLETALAGCRARHEQIVFLLPYLLFYGTLVCDLPRRVEQWQGQNLDMQVIIAPHLGVHDDLAKMVATRMGQAFNLGLPLSVPSA